MAPSPRAGPRSSSRLLVAATFVVILNETIMVNAVPRLMTDFEITSTTAQWALTVFMLTMAAVIPVTGWFLQRVTTRTAYATAMITFSTGTLVAALAPTFGVLLVGRVVQAGGTAVMMPLLMTTLMTVVAAEDRGRVMGQVTLAMSCAPALGPAVSGVLLHMGSWRLIFVAVLPIAVLVGFFGHRALENVGETTASPVSLAERGAGGRWLRDLRLRPEQGRQRRVAGADRAHRRRCGADRRLRALPGPPAALGASADGPAHPQAP
ncbi:MFS transporter [Nocardioides convexus]|uniref:MFS transporter n=1 Tax=Nocardioides convexus TaxID=2712224 RepID=UPI0024188ECA|nr:MFS transporter [Nocardioides convexus]